MHDLQTDVVYRHTAKYNNSLNYSTKQFEITWFLGFRNARTQNCLINSIKPRLVFSVLNNVCISKGSPCTSLYLDGESYSQLACNRSKY